MKYLILVILFLSFGQVKAQTPEEISILKQKNNFKRISEYQRYSKYRDSLFSFMKIRYRWPEFKKDESGDSLHLVDFKENTPVYEKLPVPLSSLSNSMSKADQLGPGGSLGLNVKGQGLLMVIWEWLGWPNAAHQDFLDPTNSNVSRITYGANLNPPLETGVPIYNYHAQSVTSTAVSGNVNFPKSTGAAPEASVIAFNAAYAWNEMFNVLSDTQYYPLSSNQSYGSHHISNTNQIASSSQDEAIIQYPYYSVVWPLGNIGTSFNTKCLATKNALYAGLMGVQGETSRQAKITSNKSRKRIIPNITTTSGGYVADQAANSHRPLNNYGEGTSHSAPNIAGGILLLQQVYHDFNLSFMRSSSARAVILHSAKDLGPIGPDLRYGYGHLDLESGAKIISNSGSTTMIIEDEINNTNQTSYTNSFKSSYNKPLKVTLVWDDERGSASNYRYLYTNGQNDPLINDLDLRVTSSNGSVSLPFKMNPNSGGNILGEAAIKGDNDKDAYEQVVIDNPIPGEVYTVTVTIKNNCRNWDLSNPSTPVLTTQGAKTNFSLVVTGINNCASNNSPNTLTITNAVNNTSPTEHANLVLIAKNEILGSTNDVKYLSGRDIYLKDGLYTHNNKTLFRIQDCPGQNYVYSNKVAEYNPIERDIIYFPISSEAQSEEQEWSESKIDDLLKVYPNPSKGKLYVEFLENSSGAYELRDVQGRLVNNNNFEDTGKLEIDMKSMGINPGIYFLIINDGNKTHVRKILFE